MGQGLPKPVAAFLFPLPHDHCHLVSSVSPGNLWLGRGQGRAENLDLDGCLGTGERWGKGGGGEGVREVKGPMEAGRFFKTLELAEPG